MRRSPLSSLPEDTEQWLLLDSWQTRLHPAARSGTAPLLVPSQNDKELPTLQVARVIGVVPELEGLHCIKLFDFRQRQVRGEDARTFARAAQALHDFGTDR